MNLKLLTFYLQSAIQQPLNFIPPGTGLPPEGSTLQECEDQRGELGVKCGTIVCSVRELEAGKPPSQLTIFAYLFVSIHLSMWWMAVVLWQLFEYYCKYNYTYYNLRVLSYGCQCHPYIESLTTLLR